MLNRPEILAPAGSPEAFYAAIHAGADAVYLGGDRFGARAYANNFNKNELIKAISYAHLYNCKVYLTLNTLIKENEFHQLYEYLSPLYEVGLDAVIIQDLGVLQYVKEQFPLLPIHASTQMTITGVSGSKYLKALGVSRIVPARELSLEEVRYIKEQVDIEIETFVHGAICYCYSGQCFMSSILGGRSGNRGRCAQPCRLPYGLYREDKLISDKSMPFLLSPKDMCTIKNIPELVEAGIDSFKIEGRMKSPVYVATVVSLYRKYLDMYLQHPEQEFIVSHEDIIMLMDTFNRGGFSQGYYHVYNGKELMSECKTGHKGVLIGKVDKVQGPNLFISLLENIYIGDRLEIIIPHKEPITLTSSVDSSSGEIIMLKANRLRDIRKGQNIYRIANQRLNEMITDKYITNHKKLELEFFGTFHIGEPASLIIRYNRHEIVVNGNIVEMAEKTPVSEQQIREQLIKTGNTIYTVKNCTLDVDNNVFLPMKNMKELRRVGISKLEEHIYNQYARPAVIECSHNKIEDKMPYEYKTELSVSIYRACYLPMVLRKKEVTRIQADYSLFSMKKWKNIVHDAHANGKKIYCIFPRIMRKNIYERILSEIDEWNSIGFDGVIAGSIDTLSYLSDQLHWQGDIILDYSLYQYNQKSVAYYQSKGVLPIELNKQELSQLEYDDSEIILYGYLPLMISVGCLKKNSIGCNGKEELLYLQDRYNKRFPVLNRCQYCYNIIFNSEPVYYLDILDDIDSLHCKGYQIHLTVEDIADAEQIVNEAINCCYYKQPVTFQPKQYTRGHWKRGIE